MNITLYNGPKALAEITGMIHEIEQKRIKHPRELFEKYTKEQIKNWKGVNLYYLLGITQEQASEFTEIQFKDAFRKQAKLFHPDRLRAMNIQDEGVSFIALGKAHQTLSNPIKRKQYDCIIFNEALPENKEYTDKEFFITFGEAFEKNSKFSTKPYIVSLGSLNSSEEQVVAFYKFWQNFDSNRVFDFLCEDEDCSSREMRRHIAKQNKEMLQEKKAQDNMRIRKLVNLAIKYDPRVNKNQKNSAPKAPVTVDADGWKSTEVSALTKLASSYPLNTRNRVEIIISSFSRHSPSRQRREIMGKLLKIDTQLKNASKK
ncbi:DnaJ-like protein subfamily C member 2 [Nematocida sp. LUAm3]|nr:DnaJ-like protein subfamily C member 2 [Nematocida sp. LUAm3]KAI5175853.1 DnaJ-like protein subfamily C member 2 [Nematocida sp. LUAm2]KAI5178349.1 DnaJ-like protein subfamily C member 2 [Nematocida sp. LUAm1]